MCTIRSQLTLQIKGSGLKENDSSSRDCSGLRKNILFGSFTLFRILSAPLYSNIYVNFTKRRYSKNQYREITTADWA